MANKSFEEDVGAIFIGFVSLTLMLVAIVTAFWLAIPVAGILCIYAGYRMYQNSDAVQERKAHELTHRLYAETKALAPAIPEAKDFAGQVYRQPERGDDRHQHQRQARQQSDWLGI